MTPEESFAEFYAARRDPCLRALVAAGTDRAAAEEAEGWLDAGPALEIPDGRAVILTPPEGERIAVFSDIQTGMWLDNTGMVERVVDRVVDWWDSLPPR